MNKRCVFLLGGYDLEMLTIKELLQTQGVVVDKNLTWDTALLSKYSKELAFYADQDCQIVGIELREDVQKPKNYVLIDHHNAYSDCASSLEQVARFFDIELTRWQQLVAINDRGYIDGLKKFGATEEEILQIRCADRKAQGISKQEEIDAEESILSAQTKKCVMVVYTKCRHFSPITDRLHPFDKLLIYNNDSLVYYGKGCKKLVHYYEKQIAVGKVYYGGGENGFVGFNKGSFCKQEIGNQIDIIVKIIEE